MQYDLAALELKLVRILRKQGFVTNEIRLIGLLGQGNRGSVFALTLGGIYHVVKVYSSKDDLRAELKNLKKVIPKDRLLFWWEEQKYSPKVNFVVLEVPEGQELNSSNLTESRAEILAVRLAELHRIRYRQRVSATSLREKLERSIPAYLKHIELMGRDIAPYKAISDELVKAVRDNPEQFRVKKARIHGDLWWANIIVTKEDVYLVDWESLRRGDPAEDIAKLRVITYGHRSPQLPTFFWQSGDDTGKMPMLMKKILEYSDDPALIKRLQFYIAYQALRELASRYIGGSTREAMNKIVADDLLNLAHDPLAAPPDLNQYGYLEEVKQEHAVAGAIR